jgi:hypothetical protein
MPVLAELDATAFVSSKDFGKFSLCAAIRNRSPSFRTAWVSIAVDPDTATMET